MAQFNKQVSMTEQLASWIAKAKQSPRDTYNVVVPFSPMRHDAFRLAGVSDNTTLEKYLPGFIAGGAAIVAAVMGWIPFGIGVGGAFAAVAYTLWTNRKQGAKSGKSAKFNLLLFVVRLTRMMILVMMLWLMRLNVEPYIAITGQISGDITSSFLPGLAPVGAALAGIWNWFVGVPLLGNVLSFIAGLLGVIPTLLTTLAGIALWCIIQSCEMLIWLVTGDPDAVKALIAAEEKLAANQMAVKDGDAEAIVWLKERFNALGLSQIFHLKRLSIVAYLIDVWLVVTFYPPVQVGEGWTNILTTAAIVIGFEVLLSKIYFPLQTFERTLKGDN